MRLVLTVPLVIALLSVVTGIIGLSAIKLSICQFIGIMPRVELVTAFINPVCCN